MSNRVIKFRAWHEGGSYAGPLKPMAGKMLYDENPGDCLRWLNDGQPVTVMQFTGLLDKNGKEVYEGDIIRYSGDYYLHTAVVEWKDADDENIFFCGFADRVLSAVEHEGDECIQLEIVGNIHENPDML